MEQQEKKDLAEILELANRMTPDQKAKALEEAEKLAKER